MAQAKRKAAVESPGLSAQLSRGLKESGFFALLAVACYLSLSLFTYSRYDPAWSFTGRGDGVENSGGVAGAWFSDITLYFLGYLAYFLPLLVLYGGWLLFHGRNAKPQPGHPALMRWLGFFIALVSGCGLATLHFTPVGAALPQTGGGVLGQMVGEGLVAAFDFAGATLFLLALFVLGFTLLTGISWLAVTEHIGASLFWLFERVRAQWVIARSRREARRVVEKREKRVKAEKKRVEKRAPPKIEAPPKKITISARAEKDKQIPLLKPTPGDGSLPPLSLLDPPQAQEKGYSNEALEAMSRQVELKLKDFGIEVAVEAVHPGPVITRFELQPAPGVKAARITALSRDLARSLSTSSVRVVEVIPGKTVIGLEIPNEHREVIALSEILSSEAYDKSGSPLTLALGKHIGGEPSVVNLAKMPHLLVAGTTGSGKSVAINAMILSLLFKSTSQEVRLILIDPKMLELSVYEGVPHLLTPVVTDMKEAANALRWSVAEMDRRYQLMAHLGVRNILGYNKKVRQAMEHGTPIPDPFWKAPETLGDEPPPEPETLRPLPYIVVVIDELADMMMLVGKKVEELIARLAQKARASGIHLILATQRPSVDVITGLIKSNIPTRISFQVSSKIDSRTIIDQGGAETLLGNGDMLYLAPGVGIPNRFHGAFVSDQEVHRVVEALKAQGEPDYDENILSEPVEEGGVGVFGGGGGSAESDDPLYDQAVRIVTESRRASVSSVQRRLKIGYNRAARLVEAMEEAGIVGALQANGQRDVLAGAPPED
ncbi:MAG: DNA translocase FtsK 4TM domain-containing protein [Chromatiales bacterium]|nr:DNA translocase FtsK 4TM domain-containing protein [Chromatiales bacterium]